MSLLSAYKLLSNQTVSARVESAIRKLGSVKMGLDGPEGDLARAAFRDPTSLVPSFMTYLATNGEVVQDSCPSCGDASSVPDSTIEWIVDNSWKSVANDLYGVPEGN